MCGSATADKNRIDFNDIARDPTMSLQFSVQRLQVLRNQVISIRDQRKITVAAVMQTKRHMNINRPRNRG